MQEMTNVNNICLRHNCSECCNPVKINSLIFINTGDSLPFVELGEILIPEKHPDSVKLKSYHCRYFNHQTGLCNNYSKRPKICQNTKCLAFQTINKKEQEKIIKEIKAEKFMRIILTGNGG